MRKLPMAMPWITASAVAGYAISQWNRLPARMAVTFYLGRATGWQAKATAIPALLLLMFGILALFLVLLLNTGKIHTYEGPLSDPEADRRQAVRLLFMAYLVLGVLAPMLLVHTVNRNL